MNDFLDHPANVRQGEELDLTKLDPYLRKHFPREAGPLRVRQYPSGHSNLTYSLQLGAKELVLRRPPFGSKVKSAHDMSREFRVLSKLHAVYRPAPEVLLYCGDEDVLGAPFYLMRPIHGVILRHQLLPGVEFPAETARRLSESFIENLICLHRVDYADAGLSDLGKPEGYLERQVRGWTDRYFAAKTHDYSGGEQQIQRICVSHKARQHPRHSVLGYQSSACKSCTESRGIRSKPYIAIQSNHQAQSHYWPIDRGDHGFRQCREIRIFVSKVISNTVGFALCVLHRLGPPRCI
jgi:Phosphotransferase enzyme family